MSPKADAEVENDVLPMARTAVAITITVLRISNLLRTRPVCVTISEDYLDAVECIVLLDGRINE
jgi:hypothetical protein